MTYGLQHVRRSVCTKHVHLVVLTITVVTSAELSQLHDLFQQVAVPNRASRQTIAVSTNQFAEIMGRVVPAIAASPVLARLFKALDTNNDNRYLLN